jgi:hypothetical protein
VLEQQYYTSSPKRLDGQAGFGVVGQTPGLSPDDALAIAPFNLYRKPLALADDDIAGAPPTFSYYSLPSGRFAVTNAAYVGKDYTGRWGNFFAHTLVGDPAELAPLAFAPIVLYGKGLWCTGEMAGGSPELSPLDVLPTIGPVKPSSASAFLTAEPGRERVLAAMLQAVIDRPTSGKRLVIADQPKNIAGWLFSISVVFPPGVRAGITFTTLASDPMRSFVDVIGVYPGETASLSGPARFQFEVFDLADPAAPPPIQPGPSAIRLARLAARGDDESAARVWAIAERLGATSPAAAAGALWLETLAAGEPAADSEIEAAIVLLGVSDSATATDLGLQMVPYLGESIPASFGSALLTTVGDQARAIGRWDDFAARVSLIAARSLADGGDTSWLARIAHVERLADLRQAIVRGLPPDLWQEALLRAIDQNRDAPGIWWLLDYALAAIGGEIDEAYLPRLAEAIAGSGQVALCDRLLDSALGIQATDEAAALNVLGFATLGLVRVWPERSAAGAVRAAAGASARGSLLAGEFVDLAAATVASRPSPEVLEAAVAAAPDASQVLVSLATRVAAQRPDAVGNLASALARLGGPDAANVREALLRAPGAEALLVSLTEHDLRARPPLEVLRIWVGVGSTTLTCQQAAIVNAVLDHVGSSAGERDVAAVFNEVRAVRTPAQLYARILMRELDSAPIAPLGRHDLRELRALSDSGVIDGASLPPRLTLMNQLTGLHSQATQAPQDSEASFIWLATAAAVEEGDYDSFLKSAFTILRKAKVLPPPALSRPQRLWHPSYPVRFAMAMGSYLGNLGRVLDEGGVERFAIAYAAELQQSGLGSAAVELVAALPRANRKVVESALSKAGIPLQARRRGGPFGGAFGSEDGSSRRGRRNG